MDEEFESFVVTNPDIVDPGIDVSGLRTTTDANILGNITDFPGIQYEAYNPNRLSDLMRLYSSGLPTLATDTAQIPGAVDTLVDAGGGGGMNQVTGGSMLDAQTDGLTQSGTFGGQPTFTTTPGTTVDDVTGDITNPDGSYGGNIVDEFVTPPSGITGDSIDVGIPDNESGFVDPLGTISGAPVVGDFSEPTTGTISDDRLNEVIGGRPMAAGPFNYLQEQTPISQVQVPGITQADLTQAEIDKERLPNYTPSFETPEQKNLIEQAFSKVGSTANDIMRDLSEIPGAVADFVGKTVDIAGQKIDVGGTLLRAGINKLAGGPISIVFDILSEIIPKQDPANTLKRNIVDELKASGKDYGFNIQSGNLNQDPFGRNPISLLGNYEQTLLNDINNPSGTKLGNAKKEFALDYFNTKAEKTAPQENIGATDSLDQLQAAETKEQQEAFADIQNQIGQSLHGGNDNKDKGPIETPSFEGFDSGGFDPAPAPVSTIPSAPPSQGFGNPNRNGGDGRGGGGGGSPGSAGPGGSDEMGSF